MAQDIGAAHDVCAKALNKVIDCHLQLALPSKTAEQVELRDVRSTDKVVCEQTDQAERAGVPNVIEKLDTD